MTEGLEKVTTAALALALDAAQLRQQAIAANIANHASAGYVPQQVRFESQLQEARRAIESNGTWDLSSLARVRPQVGPILDAHGQPARVQLDAQAADMAHNAVQYQALARALNRHFALLSMASADGKR